jgi:hypothetical protein
MIRRGRKGAEGKEVVEERTVKGDKEEVTWWEKHTPALGAPK